MQVHVDPDMLHSLVNMGYNQELAHNALDQSHNVQAKALDVLASWGQSARAQDASADTAAQTSAGAELPVVRSGAGQSAADAASLLVQALQSNMSGTTVNASRQLRTTGSVSAHDFHWMCDAFVCMRTPCALAAEPTITSHCHNAHSHNTLIRSFFLQSSPQLR